MRTPREWRDRRQDRHLEARQCESCGFVSFPEDRRICKRCRTRDEWRNVRLERSGTIRTYIVQRTLPDEFETPLPLAIIDIDTRDPVASASARVYGLFTETDPADLEIGTRVVADFRRLYDIEGVPVHSFKFMLPRGER